MARKRSKANGTRPRGRPFKPGQSGNVAGRPKGSRNRVVEFTVEEEIKRLTERGGELVMMRQDDAAQICFEKMLLLSWGGRAASPDEARNKARELVTIIRNEGLLLIWYEDADADYLRYLGLPPKATWAEYRRHYDEDGGADVDRMANDLLNYPPIAAGITELKAERDAANQQRR